MTNELRDIKPLLEIPDTSYYIYLAIVGVLAILVLSIIYFVIKKFILNRKESQAQKYLRQLKRIDWSDAKSSAYLVTYLGRELATDNRSKEIYTQLLPMLEKYKYRAKVPLVDDETLRQYELLVHVLDESI